jgi:hypothetical protein
MEQTEKRRGRPPLGDRGLSVRFNIRVSREIEAMLEQAEELWPECADRADVVRRVLVDGLRANGIEAQRG